ncbi:2OG-Fe dioxygenase family protein [Streptomyces sp. NPDC059851]|uniref:2OG-Fe dioxygenase family protein n=1 Tax=Streptomyces sp. NPDC059851 TaxID=3346971 RepID=UPI003656E432
MTDVRTGTHADALKEQGCTHSTLASVLGAGFTSTPEWHRFADSWNRLGQDGYMADGGTYRERRYSEFSYDTTGTADAALRQLPHVPYSQSLEVNYLNGGIDRHFEPFEPEVAEGTVLRSVFQWCAETLLAAAGPGTWHIQTFQNRILAKGGEQGRPTPEGLHRDGVDFVLTLLVRRNSVEGGVSSVYGATSRELVAEVLLTEPGEFLFADDRTMLHSVTPLTPETPGGEGHRDVLIAMFTRTEA